MTDSACTCTPATKALCSPDNAETLDRTGCPVHELLVPENGALGPGRLLFLSAPPADPAAPTLAELEQGHDLTDLVTDVGLTGPVVCRAADLIADGVMPRPGSLTVRLVADVHWFTDEIERAIVALTAYMAGHDEHHPFPLPINGQAYHRRRRARVRRGAR